MLEASMLQEAPKHAFMDDAAEKFLASRAALSKTSSSLRAAALTSQLIRRCYLLST
jgi:hypothetical protein